MITEHIHIDGSVWQTYLILRDFRLIYVHTNRNLNDILYIIIPFYEI